MIKLDIVNAVVAKTNISRTKAEQAVETVFESAAIRAPAKKLASPRARPFASSPARNCKASKILPPPQSKLL